MNPLRTSPAIRPGTRQAEMLSIAQPQRVAGRDRLGLNPAERRSARGA